MPRGDKNLIRLASREAAQMKKTPHYEQYLQILREELIPAMVAGNVANMPGLLSSVRFLTTAIASEMSYAAYGSLQRQALFSIGLVLFLFIILINVILNVFIKNRKEG